MSGQFLTNLLILARQFVHSNSQYGGRKSELYLLYFSFVLLCNRSWNELQTLCKILPHKIALIHH
jgi:hypothetical protein